MIELNQEIDWIPAHIRDGAFGKWLEGARDWSISRNRFWGAPIPVWKSDDPDYPRIDVYGSLDELERDFGVRPDDLHRPAIDALVRPNPDDPTGRVDHAAGDRRPRLLVRVRLDALRPGPLPLRERSEWFEAHFPADFIVRVRGPDAGLVLHPARPVHGAVRPTRLPTLRGARHRAQGDDGRKMSKRLRQLPRARHGLRHLGRRRHALVPALVADPAGPGPRRPRQGHRGGAAPGAEPDLERLVLPVALRQRRTASAGRCRTDATGVLDRYILAKTAVAGRRRHRRRWTPTTSSAPARPSPAFLDALNNWYIRRSRDRFWRARDGSAEVEADKADAYDTLSTVLVTLCKRVGAAAAAAHRGRSTGA